jgi:hypothetical protein
MTAAIVNLNHPPRFLHWHFLTISVANVVVLALIVAVFAAAILVPFPRHGGERR